MDESKEIFEPMESVVKKAKTIAGWIGESKHFIAFTGAGVSTSTGIPDFRGPQGVWTMRDKGVTVPRGHTLNKVPSPSHMALLQLARQELHGNSTRETCPKCNKEYIRDFSTRGPTASDHRNGRKCECGGELRDTIINFGESLPAIPLDLAFQHAQLADLCLVLGSSLKVNPAAEVPNTVGTKSGAKLIICNLQPTPLDEHADLIVHAKCDDLMKAICAELGVIIPEFILERRICITTDLNLRKKETLSVSIKGEDVDGTPATFLKAIKVALPDVCATQNFVFEEEPFTATTTFVGAHDLTDKNGAATLRFMGWYNEPDLDVSFSLTKAENKVLLLFQPSTGKWQILQN